MDPLRFIGRQSELDLIKKSWQLAADVENPKPQIVLITGEPGVGKTRLVFEFYRWLSEKVDQPGSDGYWPDALKLYENAVNANPQPRTCNFNVKIPYLWWGLHVSSDTITSSDRYLAPHLATLLARSIMWRKGFDLARALGRLGLDIGMDLFEDLTYLSLAKRILEAGKEGVDIVRGGVGEASIEEALRIPCSRADSIVQNLELVFDKKKRDYARTPGVILFDEAQNAEKDIALPRFIETLFYKSIKQEWPLLILVTHWKRELSSEVTPNKYSFPGILRHCLYASHYEYGPAAGYLGGYLNASNFREIELHSVEDLSAALRDQLPGLTDAQSTGILVATGGNPRYLEQVIQFAREHQSFFEELDVDKALTADGFREILNETKSQDIFKVVRRRLIDVPIEVKEAICLASLQGLRFANELVEAIAISQIGRSVGSSLENAEDTYRWVIGTRRGSGDGVGSFRERLFHQVAKDVRPHIKSLGTEAVLQSTFKKTIKSLIADHAFAISGKPETQLIVCNIAADLFETSSFPDERGLAQRALSILAKVELSRLSLESAVAAYERLLAIEPMDVNSVERIRLLNFLTSAYWKLNWRSKCASALKRRIYGAYSIIGDQGRLFALAGDEAGVRRHFDEFRENQISAWRKESDEISTDKMDNLASELYRGAISFMVPALLHMSELARAWPNLQSSDGDDPVSFAPFMLKHIEFNDQGGVVSESEPDHMEVALMMRDRAVNLGKIVEADFTEREHFKLLVDDVAQTFSADGQLDGAIDALERALKIAKDLGDHICQIQVLSNLGIVHGQRGDREQSKKIMLEAGRINNENYTGEAFPVVALSNGAGIEHRRTEAVSNEDKSRIIGHLDIPIRLASLFDRDPDEAVRRFRQLVQMVGNIEGNLGHNALIAGEFVLAEDRFKYALTNFSDLNDGPNIAMTLTNLATVAKRRGDNAKACDYWRQSLSVCKKLKVVHAGKITELRWENAIQDLESVMETSGCGEK